MQASMKWFEWVSEQSQGGEKTVDPLRQSLCLLRIKPLFH